MVDNLKLERKVNGVGNLYCLETSLPNAIRFLGSDRLLSSRDLAEIIVKDERYFFDRDKLDDEKSDEFLLREGIVPLPDKKGYLFVRNYHTFFGKSISESESKRIIEECSELAQRDASKPITERKVLRVNSHHMIKPKEFPNNEIAFWMFGDYARRLGELLIKNSCWNNCFGKTGQIEEDYANNCAGLSFYNLDGLNQLSLGLGGKSNIILASELSVSMAAFMGFESRRFYPIIEVGGAFYYYEKDYPSRPIRWLIREEDTEGFNDLAGKLRFHMALQKIEPGKSYAPKEIQLYMKAKEMGLRQ